MPATPHNLLEGTAGPAPAAGGMRAAEHLLLLTHDESLIEALRSVVPADSLAIVENEAALAQQLVGAHVGVVFLDANATHAPGATAQLTQRLHNQLPDVVLVVAGDGVAQSELAALVTDGTVYRFVHKPVSAQRVKLFVDAAWRRREGTSTSGLYPALAAVGIPAPAPAPPSRPFPWSATVAGAVVLGAITGWLLLRSNSHGVAAPPAPIGAQKPTPLPLPKVSAPAPPQAVAPVPPATTAADFDRLATAAEQALLAGNLAEASRLTEAARALYPQHVRVKFLTAQIAREQARVADRRRAAEAAAPPAALRAPPPPLAAPVPPSVSTASAPASVPVVAASATTSAPSSTPPASEARDHNSVAAVILERIYSVDPVFPEIAREQDLTGFVDLEFTVHADGSVSDVNVLKAQPKGVFEKAAVEAVSKWRYRPIQRNGQPTTEHARLRLNFAYK